MRDRSGAFGSSTPVAKVSIGMSFRPPEEDQGIIPIFLPHIKLTCIIFFLKYPEHPLKYQK